MNLQKRTLKKIKKLLIKERWFNNAEFDSLFIHTYLNTKALVLGHKSSIVILMDKRCDVLRISQNSIKETGEEILKAEKMLRKKLQLDVSPIHDWEEYIPTVEYRTVMDAVAGTVIAHPERNENNDSCYIEEDGYSGENE